MNLKPITRLVYSDVYPNYSMKSKTPNSLLGAEYSKLDRPCLVSAAVSLLAKLWFYQNHRDEQQLRHFLHEFTKAAIGRCFFDFRQRYETVTIITYENLNFVLKQALSDLSDYRSIPRFCDVEPEMLGMILLRVNDLSDKNVDSPAKDSNWINDLERFKSVIADLFRANSLMQKRRLLLQDLIANVELTKSLLLYQQGIEANALFQSTHGLSFLEYVYHALIMFFLQ